VSTPTSVLSEYLTKRDLAVQLGRSTRTIDRMSLNGDGPPPTRIGRTTLYRREAVLQWLLDRETPIRGRHSPKRRTAQRAPSRIAVEQ
jgi:predicted DNA-binding transcriptional regulator AlpA